MSESAKPSILPAQKLDDKGRCCGRKPLVYKRPPHLFCDRCCASFDAVTGTQIENCAFAPSGGGFVFKMPHMEAERS